MLQSFLGVDEEGCGGAGCSLPFAGGSLGAGSEVLASMHTIFGLDDLLFRR